MIVVFHLEVPLQHALRGYCWDAGGKKIIRSDRKSHLQIEHEYDSAAAAVGSRSSVDFRLYCIVESFCLSFRLLFFERIYFLFLIVSQPSGMMVSQLNVWRFVNTEEKGNGTPRHKRILCRVASPIVAAWMLLIVARRPVFAIVQSPIWADRRGVLRDKRSRIYQCR